MAEFPDDMELWRQRADWLLKDFISTGKKAKGWLEQMLEFANGDTSAPVITHWCLTSKGPRGEPCCKSDEESIYKFLSHAVYWFGKGFDTPLLYRMKHYGVASSFMKIGTNFFNLLPRALQEMASMNPKQSAENSEFVDALLLEQGTSASEQAANDFQHLLADALDADRNYAAQNGVRCRMVTEELCKPGFIENSILVDAIIQPMEYGVNYLMGHTKILHDLNYLGRGHPNASSLQKAAQSRFLNVVSGKLGDELIQRYVELLQSGLQEAVQMGMAPSAERLNLLFNIALLCISDVHRRFKDFFRSPPYTLFQLLDLSASDFADAFSSLEERFQRCPSCFDFEFSAALIGQHQGFSAGDGCRKDFVRLEVQDLLRDISRFTPVTSDVVEIKNGNVQWVCSKRGSQDVKGGPAAVETSLIQAAVKQHRWVQDSVAEQTLPAKRVASGILKMSGTRSINQYTEAATSLVTTRSTV